METRLLHELKTVTNAGANFSKKIKKDGRPVILWGAGHCARIVIDLCEGSNIEILAIVDNDSNKWGKTFQGYTIISWEEAKKLSRKFGIFISISHYEEIIKQLEEEYDGKIYYLPMAAYHMGWTFCNLDYIKKNESHFQAAYEMFKDETSRKVFLAMLKNRISWDDRYYKEIEDLDIHGYFGTDLYINKSDEVIVDGGAFNGDTIRELLSHPQYSFKKIYAFEPDEKNFELLKENVANDSKVVPMCAGLGEKKESLRFITGKGMGSYVAEDGMAFINIETIDNVCSEEPPTFIKLDVEGAERAALLGAKNIIDKYHPTLAISAYHKKEDLFDLVELIQLLGSKQYDIYLRHTFYYADSIGVTQPDIIIYAIKKNENKSE